MHGRRRFRTTAVAVAAVTLLGAGTSAGCSAGAERPPAATAAPSTGTAPAPRAASSAAAAPSTPVAAPWLGSPASVAAVGDSVTRAYDACGVLSDCPEASWATGTDPAVNSLALRLLGPGRVATHSWNLARSGSRMVELPEQMARAAAHRPALVTVMTGANDACRKTPDLMTPVEDFRFFFETALARLREESPASRVYVASVPDLMRLWSTGRLSPMAREVWKLGVCGSMLAAPQDDSPAAERRRARVQERVRAYNEVLAEVCAKDRLCRYDGGAVHAFRFDGGQLSPWDWFHPSRDGQARLAELAYRRITAG
ncbi:MULTISPECIES: SGNH/GDSL hydrolase family protein [unclassified Streptomyces]|uniref:SGNH/GDSL hydrolase family protein n=1 Tax=unclassified Streptomyces TaxID=2593676 RepID=UPI0036B69448